MSDLPILPPLHEWHQVPVGATIPAGTPYMIECLVFLGGAEYDREVTSLTPPHWTPEPLTAPLPTKEGAHIIARRDGSSARFLLTRTSTGWASVTGSASTYFDSDILEWALLPADLVWRTR